MMPATLTHLHGLYDVKDDPWDFRGSSYEAERLDAARAAVLRGWFVEGFLPCALPDDLDGTGFDFVLLSGVL